jgi:hypothetical protein
MSTFPAELVRNFNAPTKRFFRAFDHLIGARNGMVLLVPMVASMGKLDAVVDMCPVPHLEATAIIAADYEAGTKFDLEAFVFSPGWNRINNFSPLAKIGRDFAEMFLGGYGIFAHDQQWRHLQIRLSPGEAPCRVLIGMNGTRLAFTPDFF